MIRTMRETCMLAAAALFAGVTFPAMAQSSSAVTGASAEIVEAAPISTTQNLVFTVTTTAGLSGINSIGLTTHLASFGDTVSVSTPATFNVTNLNGNTVLTVQTASSAGNVLSSQNAAAPASIGVVNANGTLTTVQNTVTGGPGVGSTVVPLQPPQTVAELLGGESGANQPGGTIVAGTLSGGPLIAPVQVVGRLDQAQLSFNMGGAALVASALAPGQYHGVLVVIAQYN
jgi:hypothetical protein